VSAANQIRGIPRILWKSTAAPFSSSHRKVRGSQLLSPTSMELNHLGQKLGRLQRLIVF
jgi:hypothetical protein